MPTPSDTFHGCFGRTFAKEKFTGDPSKFLDFTSSEWKQVKSKNRGKFDDEKILNSNQGWKVVSNSNKMMNLAVAPKLCQSSSFQQKQRFKIDNRQNRMTRNASQPDNFMDLPLATFSENLKQLVASQRNLQDTLTQVDSVLKTVKQDLTDSAKMLVLQKGLVRKLQQFQDQQNPVILKTKNATKLQKK
jgi:hypothetical protein